VRPGRRALRSDVICRRNAPAGLLRNFHHPHPGTDLDVVALFDAGAAVDAVRSGTIDASFRAVTWPARQLPDGIETARAHYRSHRPNFGTEPLLDVLADYGLRRIALRNPTPSTCTHLIWRSDNHHPGLTTLRDYLGSTQPRPVNADPWTPKWA
jgi:hypothetical protein